MCAAVLLGCSSPWMSHCVQRTNEQEYNLLRAHQSTYRSRLRTLTSNLMLYARVLTAN